MPVMGSTSITGSPAAGLPVVLSVTVPVNCTACANVPAKRMIATAACKKVFIDFMILSGVLISVCLCLPLQVIHLGEQRCCFIFKLRALCSEVFFRIFAGAIFEVEVT